MILLIPGASDLYFKFTISCAYLLREFLVTASQFPERVPNKSRTRYMQVITIVRLNQNRKMNKWCIVAQRQNQYKLNEQDPQNFKNIAPCIF